MKERSPRFPFIPLEEAIQHLHKLREAADGREGVDRETFLSALGYSSAHGAAMKTLAALRGYDLIEGKPRQLRLSETGQRLLDTAPDSEERLPLLRRAALSPLMFRRIWRRARHFSTDELTELLILRGFTESGARRASDIYQQNSGLAQLEELDIEPELPERKGAGPKKKMAARRQRAAQKRVEAALARGPGGPRPNRGGPAPNMLTLPLSTGRAAIPAGISNEEFKLLMQTLRIWKPRIVAGAAE